MGADGGGTDVRQRRGRGLTSIRSWIGAPDERSLLGGSAAATKCSSSGSRQGTWSSAPTPRRAGARSHGLVGRLMAGTATGHEWRDGIGSPTLELEDLEE